MNSDISGAEAARRLGLSWRTFSDLLPTIPHQRAGRQIFIDAVDLEQWLEGQRVQPGTLGHLLAYGAGDQA